MLSIPSQHSSIDYMQSCKQIFPFEQISVHFSSLTALTEGADSAK